MTLKHLTTDEHRQVLERLVRLSARAQGALTHAAGLEYTSLMMCFLLHSKSVTDSLLALHRAFSGDWFPATVGYVVVRSLFEVDVTAHYLAKAPVERSRRYINFGWVINKQRLDAVNRHRNSSEPSWKEAMTAEYERYWLQRATEVNAAFAKVSSTFKKKNGSIATSWSGKSLKEMATEVGHVEAYDVFYAYLSSFTHMNVKAANRFLRIDPDGPTWTQRATQFDVASIFQHAAIFLTCFLELFGEQFATWSPADVDGCWAFQRRTVAPAARRSSWPPTWATQAGPDQTSARSPALAIKPTRGCTRFRSMSSRDIR